MRKNHWMTFDTVTGVQTGSGRGARLESSLRPGEVLRYRDTAAEVAAEPGSAYVASMASAHKSLTAATGADRSQAFARKEAAARAYMARVISDPDRLLSGPGGLATIDPAAESILYAEYAATNSLLGSITPTALAALIITRADEAEAEEVARRVAILTAEADLGQVVPPIPEE